MRGTSEVIMGATLIMAATLAIVLSLVVVLLAELYCSLLLRRQRTIYNTDTTATPTTVTATPITTASLDSNAFHSDHGSRRPDTSSLSNFYSHGVLRAPTNLLFPALSYPESDHHLRHSPTEFVSVTVPTLQEQHSDMEKHRMYISNPVYDAGKSDPFAVTPFETPDSSPSRLEAAASSSPSDEADRRVERVEVSVSSAAVTPPLTPMKKLPAMACSVALRDVRSLCTSCSDSNTNLELLSSSSETPCTSPW